MRHVVTLPVHHGLRAENMIRMGQLLNQWNRTKASDGAG
jgi:hypothetical protein